MPFKRGLALVWSCRGCQRRGYTRSARKLPPYKKIDEDAVLEQMASCAKLATIHARLALSDTVPKSTLAQVMIDESALRDRSKTNAQLASLGNSISKFLVHEYLLTRWPRLPDAIMQSAVSAFSGKASMAALVKSWGVELGAPDQNFVGRILAGRVRPSYLQDPQHRYAEVAMSQMAKALIGAIYIHNGFEAAKKFVYEHFLSRHLSLEKLFSISDPIRQLARLSAREGFSTPVARMLAETGRRSRAPVYLVGIFVDGEQVGEGEGASIREAHHRAAGNALRSWYLYEERNFEVPSVTLEDSMNVDDFKAVPVDHGEVIV